MRCPALVEQKTHKSRCEIPSWSGTLNPDPPFFRQVLQVSTKVFANQTEVALYDLMPIFVLSHMKNVSSLKISEKEKKMKLATVKRLLE